MATEPAGDPELSVALSPSLNEWIEERAAALGVEREALLVQLLGTYRAVADLDDDGIEALFESTDLDETIESAVEAHLGSDRTTLDGVEGDVERIKGRVDDIDSRIDDIEAQLTNNVEDIRNRVLQLRDALEERAPADHDHSEISELSRQVESLSTDIDSVDGEIGTVAEEMSTVDERLDEIDSKLDRLARVVVTLRRREDAATAATERLDHIRRSANRNGTTTAVCDGCSETVQIDLLTEAACPHCGQRFFDLKASTSLLRWFKSPRLTVKEDDFTYPADQKNTGKKLPPENSDE